MTRILVCLSVIAAMGMVGCSHGDGPNDPGMTSAEIQKVRAAAAKPTDGSGPGSAPLDPNHPKRR